MRALVIEDGQKIASFIARGLGYADFEVEQCNCGEIALQLMTQEAYDVATLELDLRKLRQNTHHLAGATCDIQDTPAFGRE